MPRRTQRFSEAAHNMNDVTGYSISAAKRQCIRIEKNGARATDIWMRFSRDFRPVAALFVDGICLNTGNFTAAERKELAEALAA